MKQKLDKKYTSSINKKQYILNLQKNRSLVAVVASFVSVVLAIYAIVSGLILYTRNGVAPIDLFQYFTIDANILTAFGAAMMIPYAVDGLRKKRFYCPKWAMCFHYSGVVCITLIMFFAVFVISIIDKEMAFYGYNFYLHIICPIMILISFFVIESYYKISIKMSLMSIIPVFVYALIYIYEVIIKGTSAGGWEDIYYFTKFASPVFSFVAMMLISFLIAVIIGLIYNKLSRVREKKFIDNLWGDDASPIEIKIELFGLGRFMGKKENKSYAIIPLDIILLISDKYHIKREELIRAFIKGMLDSLDDKIKEE